MNSRINTKKFILALLVLLLPISVSAGLVGDFLATIFKNPVKENLFEGKNVQNMALLVAVNSPLGGGGAAPTVEADALVSNIGPSGTSAPDAVSHKASSDQISTYVVREGDTLSQIAEMFGVSVNTIKWGNDLSSNTLKEGQTLVILPITGVKHTVVKGDTVSSLAKKYNADSEEILAYNNLKSGESLIVGATVIVPDGEAAVSSSSSGPSTGVVITRREYIGYYLKPISGIKTQGIHGYNGVDLAAPVGTTIMASADGEVIISKTGGWNGGYGNYIVIKHDNGTQTLYAHNNTNSVSVGDSVKKGDVIGTVGSTGKSTGPHVHFEVRGAKNPF